MNALFNLSIVSLEMILRNPYHYIKLIIIYYKQ